MQDENKDTPMSDNNSPPCCFDLGTTLAVWILRIWLGFRALVAGIEKYSGSVSEAKAITIDGKVNDYGLVAEGSEKVYGLGLYNGVPSALYDKFDAEPMIPSFLLPSFDAMLGPVLLITGIFLLLGILSRISLFVMGIIYTSLTFGLILINQSSGVAWLGTHILLVVAMLCLSKHNRLELTGRLKL
jgi:thiosulfate dehydrogenase [quinone] large subunit